MKCNYLLIIFGFIFLIFFQSCGKSEKIKVVCLGDDITIGSIKTSLSDSYPVILNEILGEKFEVLNFATPKATIYNKPVTSFSNSWNFSNLNAYKPDIVVLMIGANDTKLNNWNNSYNCIKEDYIQLIGKIQSINSKSRIFVCTPICSFKNDEGIGDKTILENLSSIIRETAKELNIALIDLNIIFPINQSLFVDNIYPNGQGNKIIANEVSKIILKHL